MTSTRNLTSLWAMVKPWPVLYCMLYCMLQVWGVCRWQVQGVSQDSGPWWSPGQCCTVCCTVYCTVCCRYEEYVDDKYKEYHRTQGNAEALASVDVMGALDMYAQQGEWERCITTAEQQVTMHIVLRARKISSIDRNSRVIDNFCDDFL